MSQAKPSVRIVENSSAAKLSHPTIVVGIPEIGLVGTIAASYLVDTLDLAEIASVESDLTPAVIVVKNSEPKQPIRIFGNSALAVAVSEVPLPPRLSFEFASEIAKWSKAIQGKMVVGVTGLPSQARVESAGDSTPLVVGVSNDENIRKSISSIGAQPFEHGVIASTYATLLMRCTALGVPNLTLLSESYSEFPDPGAAAAAVEVLSKLLAITVDVKPLLEGAEEIRLRLRGLMSQTQQTIQQQQQQQPQGAQTTPSVYK